MQVLNPFQKLSQHVSMLNTTRAKMLTSLVIAVQGDLSLMLAGKRSTPLQATQQMLRSDMPLPQAKQTLEAGASTLCCRSIKMRDTGHIPGHLMRSNFRQAGRTSSKSWSIPMMAVRGLLSSIASSRRVKVW